MQNSTTNKSSVFQITTTGGAGLTYSSSSVTWNPTVVVGHGMLTEENGELVWTRPDGSKCVLTGKGASFNNLYEKLQ